MNIHNTQNINFGATRVLTVRAASKTNPEVLEIFRLNHDEDLGFIKKCYEMLKNNRKLKLNLFEKKFKSLFSDLLVKANAVSEDFYLAIKNNETIVGCMNSVPFNRDVIPLNLFARESKSEISDSLFYAFLKDSQANYNNFNIKMDVLTNAKDDEARIMPKEIDSYKNLIRSENRKYRFKSENEKVNMDDVLGTRDFETELNLN